MISKKYKNLTANFLLSLLICLSSSASALSSLKGDRISTISFAKGDFSLNADAKEELMKHISCANTLSLEVILIMAFGDDVPDEAENAKQIELAAHRALEIRNFFIVAGVPEYRLYAESPPISEVPSHFLRLRQSERLERVGVIETAGECKSTSKGNDCRVLCKGN